MKAEFSRRSILGGSAAVAGAALSGCSIGDEAESGSLGGPSLQRGHRLRDAGFPPPSETAEDADLVIAGGGIAGLAAAWRLKTAGFDRFTLLELEDATGGNARSGRNAVSAYPLGAHYLQVPNREAKALIQMLRQFGMIVGDEGGAPVYDPLQLCADQEERLFWRGRWQEGLYPQTGLTRRDDAERNAFNAEMARYREASGSDGKPAFAVPMAYSSKDDDFVRLDRQTFSSWLDEKGWVGAPLRAYVRYCCRDDYGSEPENVSAWAGIHYFAGRRGWASGADGDRELTWPEGNGRLAKLMTGAVAAHVRRGATVFKVEAGRDGVSVDAFDHERGRSIRHRSNAAILAMPHFVADRVAGEQPSNGFSYAPWVVANVTVDHHPRGEGSPLAWDNVSAGSDSLGYVVATHQTSSAADGPTVLTWYKPLSRTEPAAARKQMLTAPLRKWQDEVREDMLQIHPELRGFIRRIDVWLWGHGMIRPTPGFLSDPARVRAWKLEPPVFRAHSDLSGLSLFEEAHDRGVRAAEAALGFLGHPFESLL